MDHKHRDDVRWEPAGDEHFTGAVMFGPHRSPEDPDDMNVLGVRFEPGARTDWHHHPGGQVLYVVEGTARVQTQSGDTIEVGEGGSVYSPPGETHWHGATPDGSMTHLSITHRGATEWLPRKVSDEEYEG